MRGSRIIDAVAVVLVAMVVFIAPAKAASTTSYPLTVLPPESKEITDPETGTQLTFLTTNPAEDANLYYEQRSWLSDNSLILFTSARPEGGLMGYIVATHELVRLNTPKGALGCPTAAAKRPVIFAIRGAEVVEIALKIEPGRDPAQSRSRVTATERVIATLPAEWMPVNTSLTENATGTLLAIGVGGRNLPGSTAETLKQEARVVTIHIKSGKVKEVFRVAGKDFTGHVVFSRTNPSWVSFCSNTSWIMVFDVSKKKVVFQHKKVPGEFATHHCWWTGNLITFCGGFHPQPKEDADVKTIDVTTGVVRIVGKGSWWPEAKPIEIAKRNWWHSSGSDDGFWVAGDNWHGDIMLFEGKTTRPHLLTAGHRTYGKGDHPHVGWDRKGEKVVFTSHMLGNPNVCIATIPPAWREPLPANSANNYPKDRPKPAE